MWDLASDAAHDSTAPSVDEWRPRPAPGKVTRSERLTPHGRGAAPSVAPALQADRGALAGDDPFALHLIAQRGVATGASTLPHAAAIQTSFGHHDVSSVRAHVGGAAAEASAAIGAAAYATGDSVAFAASPDLRQAAHEAAHVVQQRGGVRLDGGLGQVGDPYEQHADAVADHVVRGESAEALLDTMAHRGASGGPAVQRLVAARDSSAIQIVQRLLADASAAEASALNTTMAEVALARHSEMEIRASVDFVHRGEVYRLLIPLLDVAHLALECSTAATAARSRPRTRGRRAGGARELTSLGRGPLAQLIRTLGGEVGEEQEVEATLRVPIPDTPACVTGVLAMQIAHSAEGYTVELSPQLGLGLLEGHNHADLLANSTIEVTGHSPEMAAELIAVALEHTLRNLGNQPPPPLVTAALVGAVAAAPEVTVPAVIAYALYRTGRYVVTGDGSDPIFPLVADAIFGANHMRTVRRAMTDGDSVETIDGMSVGGEAGAGEGHGRVEGGATLGAARHWSMEREDGHVEEAEWTSVDLEFTGEAHGFAAEVGIHLPMTRGAHVPGGEIEIELAAQAETESVETLVTLDVFARAIQLAVTALHDVAHAEEAITRLRAGSGAVGTLASGARSFIAARAVRGGATAQIGIVLALTFPLDGSEPCTLEVKITDGFEHEGAGQEIEYSHARSIGTVPFGGPAAHRAVSPDGGTTAAPEVVHAAAQRGLTGASGALPHAAAIQASFGHHDVGGIAAHVGGPVAEAADAIGARAYATGNAVAFAAAPDLRQAAHEAAHVVQQRGEVRLDGGVGRAGDPYEQHADAVADHVVRGASAEALLDTMAHRGASGGPAVQRLDADGDGVEDAPANTAWPRGADRRLTEAAVAQLRELTIEATRGGSHGERGTLAVADVGSFDSVRGWTDERINRALRLLADLDHGTDTTRRGGHARGRRGAADRPTMAWGNHLDDLGLPDRTTPEARAAEYQNLLEFVDRLDHLSEATLGAEYSPEGGHGGMASMPTVRLAGAAVGVHPRALYLAAAAQVGMDTRAERTEGGGHFVPAGGFRALLIDVAQMANRLGTEAAPSRGRRPGDPRRRDRSAAMADGGQIYGVLRGELDRALQVLEDQAHGTDTVAGYRHTEHREPAMRAFILGHAEEIRALPATASDEEAGAAARRIADLLAGVSGVARSHGFGSIDPHGTEHAMGVAVDIYNGAGTDGGLTNFAPPREYWPFIQRLIAHHGGGAAGIATTARPDSWSDLDGPHVSEDQATQARAIATLVRSHGVAEADAIAAEAAPDADVARADTRTSGHLTRLRNRTRHAFVGRRNALTHATTTRGHRPSALDERMRDDAAREIASLDADLMAVDGTSHAALVLMVTRHHQALLAIEGHQDAEGGVAPAAPAPGRGHRAPTDPLAAVGPDDARGTAHDLSRIIADLEAMGTDVDAAVERHSIGELAELVAARPFRRWLTTVSDPDRPLYDQPTTMVDAFNDVEGTRFYGGHHWEVAELSESAGASSLLDDSGGEPTGYAGVLARDMARRSPAILERILDIMAESDGGRRALFGSAELMTPASTGEVAPVCTTEGTTDAVPAAHDPAASVAPGPLAAGADPTLHAALLEHLPDTDAVLRRVHERVVAPYTAGRGDRAAILRDLRDRGFYVTTSGE